LESIDNNCAQCERPYRPEVHRRKMLIYEAVVTMPKIGDAEVPHFCGGQLQASP